MFNIASIRSGILQKLGTSTQNEETPTAKDVSSESIPTEGDRDTGVVENPQVVNSDTDIGNTTQDRLTSATHQQPDNRDSGYGDVVMNEDVVTNEADACDGESVQGQEKMVWEEREVGKETILPSETEKSVNGFDVKNCDTFKTAGHEKDAVSSPCAVTKDVLSSTNRLSCPSGHGSTEDLAHEATADRPVPVSYSPASQNIMITESHSHKNDSLTQQQGDTANLEADLGIVIKTEKFDEGYEQHCTVAAPSSFAEINENLDGFDNVFIPKKERVDDNDDQDDVVILGVGYRNPYSDSDGSDSDSSTLSFEIDSTNRRGSPREHEDVYEEPRTKGELFPEDLPPLEDLQISISDTTKLVQIGEVTGIVDILAVIKSTLVLDGHVLPVNDDTVFFFENRKPFGKVFEVFGPTRSPFYSVRFNSREDIVNKEVDIGLKVFFAPEPEPELTDITHYVFVDSLLKIKGSDASWQDNNEPPDTMLEYSDDEEEKRAKAKRKGKKKQGAEDDGDVAKAKKGGHANNTAEEGVSSSSDPSQRRYKRPTNSHRGRGGFGGGFSGARPPFTGPSAGGMDGQRPPIFSGSNNRMDSQRPPTFPGPRNRMDFNRPPMFSGPNNRIDSPQQPPPMFSGPNNQNSQQPPPMFSGPGDRIPFQRTSVFSGSSNGMNSQVPPPPMFSSPVDGMLSQRPPMFSGPPNVINSHPLPPPVFSGPPGGMNSQPPPPVFSGSANGTMPSQPPPPPMFSGSANRMNSHTPFNFSGPPSGIPPPPQPSMFSAPLHQPHQFGCWVPPQPNPAFTGTQGNPDQGTPQWGYHN